MRPRRLEKYNPALFITTLEEERDTQLRLLKQLERQLNPDTGQRITPCQRKNGFQFYARLPGLPRRYLPIKQNTELIRKLCQQEYHRKLKIALEQRLALLDGFLSTYAQLTPLNVLPTLHKGIQSHVSPIVLTDDQYAEKWQKEPFLHMTPAENGHTSVRGEKVRSKSEVLIANRLHELGIPYRYEEEVTLCGRTYYTDFTVLNKRTRKEFYWEHLGMMDNSDYVEHNITKLRNYIKAGYFPGNNLLLTFETSERPLDGDEIEKVIKEYLF